MFKKGDPKPPNSGRKPGQPNRTTIRAKQVFQEAFDGLGGVEALIAWARKNKTEFYRHYARLIPHEVSGPDGGPIKVEDTFGAAVRSAPAALQAVLNSLTEEERHEAMSEFRSGEPPVH